MKAKNSMLKDVRLGRGLATFALLLATMSSASIAGAVYTLPGQRVVAWQGNVGVSGDIPTRNTIYKTLNPSGGDDTSAIQTAINNCPAGEVVKLNAGKFNITQIVMKSNVTLRGAGIGLTILKGTSTTSRFLLSFNNGGGGFGTSINLASGYTKGSTTITTSTTHGWAAGDIILIDQLQNPTGNPPISNVGAGGTDTWDNRSSGTRPVGQVARVVSASGTSATLELPLYWSFDPNKSPQGTKIAIGVHDAGAEKLTLDNSTSWNSSQQNNGTVFFYGAANCWLLGVDVYGVWGEGIMIESAYRNTIRSSRIHLSHAYTSSAGYAILMTWGASANLIEDCIFDNLSNGPVIVGPSSGNVLAYNYSTKMYSTTYPNTIRGGMQNCHGPHPIMNLFEGNYLEGCYMFADNYWGSSSNNTWFRNRVFPHASITTNYTQQLLDLAIDNNQTYYNVIGNILGTAGFENSYQSTAIPYSSSLRIVYVLGYDAGTYGLETSSLIRHGNWDSVNNAVVWDPNISDHTLPPSLYLTARPGWWPSPMPWPSIGPDLTPMSGSIPARQRYLLTPPTAGTPSAK